MSGGETSAGLVVVGVDGSDASRRALHFAIDEARCRHARLRVVVAYELPVSPVFIPYGGPHILAERAYDDATRMAERLVAESPGVNEVDVRIDARPGAPATVLLQRSTDADLLVVGSRGLGGFRGLLLGSVSQQCVQHATCPVTVVPGGQPERSPAAVGHDAADVVGPLL